VIAASIPAAAWQPGLFWDTEHPYHYVRASGRSPLLIVGGEDHKTGQKDDGRDRWAALEKWARERFPQMGKVQYRWSGQVMEPMDGVAYIGRNPGDENVWIATGDSGNGMTHGVIAGILLRDLVLGRQNEWQKLYDPSRKSLRAAAEFTRENLNMVAQYRDWLTPGEVDREDDIPKGAGAVVRHGLHKHAVYRDASGTLHRCSATCPHLGAIVTWNSAECTWDCPAHGSRFDAQGHVINGPANGDLGAADEEKEKERRAG
jgi:Rieske Fe-S protein